MIHVIHTIGEVLAGVRGAQLRDVQLLHRSGLRPIYRGFPQRSPWEVSMPRLTGSCFEMQVWLIAAASVTASASAVVGGDTTTAVASVCYDFRPSSG